MKKYLFMLMVVACSTTQDEKLHLQSVETHDLAIKIGEHVKEKIGQIDTKTNLLEEPLKSLLKDSVLVLTQEYTHWESTIVEVPGHEHAHHDHDHAGHDHDHSPAANLTPEMVLEIQRDIRDRIVNLNIRAQKLLDTLNKMDNEEPVEEKEKASGYGA